MDAVARRGIQRTAELFVAQDPRQTTRELIGLKMQVAEREFERLAARRRLPRRDARRPRPRDVVAFGPGGGATSPIPVFFSAPLVQKNMTSPRTSSSGNRRRQNAVLEIGRLERQSNRTKFLIYFHEGTARHDPLINALIAAMPRGGLTRADLGTLLARLDPSYRIRYNSLIFDPTNDAPVRRLVL